MTDSRSTLKMVGALSWPQLTVTFALGALCHAAIPPVLRWLVRARRSLNRIPGSTKATNNAVALKAGGPVWKVLCMSPHFVDPLRKLLPSQSWEVVDISSLEDYAEHADAIAIVAIKYIMHHVYHCRVVLSFMLLTLLVEMLSMLPYDCMNQTSVAWENQSRSARVIHRPSVSNALYLHCSSCCHPHCHTADATTKEQLHSCLIFACFRYSFS